MSAEAKCDPLLQLLPEAKVSGDLFQALVLLEPERKTKEHKSLTFIKAEINEKSLSIGKIDWKKRRENVHRIRSGPQLE